MPSPYYFSQTENFAIAVGSGIVTRADLFDIYDEIERSNIQPGYRSLADHRLSDFSKLSSQDIKEAKQQANTVFAGMGGNDRFAILTSRTLEFGISRMYEMTEESPLFKIRVFSEAEEALQWLDISAESLTQIANEGGISLYIDPDWK